MNDKASPTDADFVEDDYGCKQAPVFPSRHHERVHELLCRLISTGSAQFFADAYAIWGHRPAYPTVTHVVAHLIREVESAVRAVLLTLPEARRHLVESVKTTTQAKTKPSKKARKKTNKEGASHLPVINAILAALELDSDTAAAAWRSFAGDGSWSVPAHRDDLRSPRGVAQEFSDRLELFVSALASILDAAEARCATILTTLDAVLLMPEPTGDALALVANHLGSGATAVAHIFDKVGKGWLISLRDKGAFRDPPAPLTHEDGGVSFPRWPQAAYLTRIAPEVPSEVAATIEAIPLTDNEAIHWEFMKAAIAMPAIDAARIAHIETARVSASKRHSLLVPSAIGELAAHLIDGEAFDAATELLRAALSFVPDQPARRWRPSAIPRFAAWQFEEIVRLAVPELVERAPERAGELLVELIRTGTVDGSSRWRAAVEDHYQNVTDEPQDLLLVELRKLLEAQVATHGETALRSAVRELESLGAPIFRRLALHLLRLHGAIAPDLVIERATDLELLGNTEIFHELASMIADRFPDLRPEHQRRIIEAVRAHSSVERCRADTLDEEDALMIARLTRHTWFAVLGGRRVPELADEYEALCRDHGEPEHPTFHAWLGEVQTGPNPPRRATELAKLPECELIEYLANWAPTSDDRFAASFEGLGREVKALVSMEPVRWSKKASMFRGLRQKYVAALLQAIVEFIKSQSKDGDACRAIDWASVLDLAQWAVGKRTASSREVGTKADDWDWAARMAIDVGDTAAGVLPALTPRGSAIVQPLLDDPDPTPERIRSSNYHGDMLSLNTVRGHALAAAISIVEHLPVDADAEAQRQANELLILVLQRADPLVEPCEAVRSVLAQRFNGLFKIDRVRAIATACSIFPIDRGTYEARRVLWETFLRWNPVAGLVFAALREHYEVAVDAVASAGPDAAENLGHHLLRLAIQGAIDPGESILANYVARAASDARQKVLSDFGRRMHREKAPLSDELVQRIKRVWDAWARVSTQTNDPSDLAAFGWWFTSSNFDADWLLSTLRATLEATSGVLEWDHDVAVKLAVHAKEHPSAVLECLSLFVGSGNEFRIPRSRDGIRGALTALRDGPTAGDAAILASRLAARGFVEFRDLAASAG